MYKCNVFVMTFCLYMVAFTSKTWAQVTSTLTVLSSDVNLGSVRSYSMDDGIITVTPNKTSANFSGTAELVAVPQAGKVFVGWSDSVLNNPRIVTVSQDTTFTAIFDDCENVDISWMYRQSEAYWKYLIYLARC